MFYYRRQANVSCRFFCDYLLFSHILLLLFAKSFKKILLSAKQ